MDKFKMETKDIWLKKTLDGVDFEVIANLEYENGVRFILETRMNPGVDHTEEVVIWLENGDKIT